jgi:short-subunit dehydrogenase
MNLAHARVMLTGATGGIGSAIARELGRAGADLILTDLDRITLDAEGAALAQQGIQSLLAPANLARAEDRSSLVEIAESRSCNVLINVAGVNPFGLLDDQTRRQIESTFQINTIVPILLCQALLPILRQNEASHIVNLGSSFGSIGYPGFAVYSASKFALRGFSEALRRELADTSVKVHYVAPRATETRLATDRIRAMNRELKVGMDTPEAVARIVASVLGAEQRDYYLGWPERLFSKVNGLMPGLVDRVVARQLPIIRRYASEHTKVHEDRATHQIHQHA